VARGVTNWYQSASTSSYEFVDKMMRYTHYKTTKFIMIFKACQLILQAKHLTHEHVQQKFPYLLDNALKLTFSSDNVNTMGIYNSTLDTMETISTLYFIMLFNITKTRNLTNLL
jgi:hypothetical protein